MERLNLKLVIVFLTIIAQHSDATVLFTADCDLRYKNMDFKEDSTEAYVISLSLRKVFSDKMGDRIILFLLAETMHNFKENMIDQGYLQYKGPLGRWNITLGRYRLPYGLLPNYSTDRLLIKTIEDETIGFCSDNGLQFSGFVGSFDYAISLSQGVGEVFKPIDVKNNGLITLRIGYQGIDFEDFRFGLSGLFGKIKLHDKTASLNKRLLCFDIIKYSGPLVFRGEVSFGKEDEERLLAAFSGVDYAIFPKVDLNMGYAWVRDKKQDLSIGLTYNILSNLQIRVAQKIPIGGEKNEFYAQVYYIFSRIF